MNNNGFKLKIKLVYPLIKESVVQWLKSAIGLIRHISYNVQEMDIRV